MVVPDELTRESLRSRFIDTYDPPNDLDPHELVADYEAFTDYVARNPNAGSYAVASAIDAPRGRVRPWIDDGAMPDAARGVFTADRQGWFAVDGETHLELTRLVAGVFAGGGIAEKTFVPTFSADRSESLAAASRAIGAGVERLDRDHPERGDEIQSARHRSILGRVLAARDAPVGSKNSTETVPTYLFEDDQGAAADVFLQTYVRLRGVRPDGREHVQVLEHQRQPSYLDSLHTLFDQRVPGRVSRAQNGVLIPAGTLSSVLWLHEAASSL